MNTRTSSPAIKKHIEEDYNRRLLKNITKELEIIRISLRFKGRNYLRDAIELIGYKEQLYICDYVAKKYQKASASVESNYSIFEILMCNWFRLHKNNFYCDKLSPEYSMYAVKNISDLQRFIELMKIIK